MTSTTYDTVGRMVTLLSPDAGLTEYRYDLNGNLVEKQTAVLRAANQRIKYVYDLNRLKQIQYPSSPAVTYTYGTAADAGSTPGNIAGRIKSVTFDNGNELRFYDSMGNVRETRTTLNRMSTTTGLPASMTFNMKYTYDWLGRMQTMTFPNWINQTFGFVSGEGEKVTYTYDLGGNIDRITGHYQTPNPQQTTPPDVVYLDHMGYDQFSARRVLISGNGIQNKYGYDAARRLTLLAASARGALEVQQNRSATPFHAFLYEYDKNGNVTRMKNQVSVQPWRNASVAVGPNDVRYTYDALNQLRTMTAKYRPNVAYGYQSADTYTYDEIGNITTKAQSQDRLVWDSQTVNTGDLDPIATQLAGSRFDHNVAALSYNLTYQYTGTRPHATNSITETPAGSTAKSRPYSYDANGNNIGNTFQNNVRVQTWDEENRLKQVTKNGGSLAQFRYNDEGERTKKLTAAGDAWYVNQYFVLLPGNRPTKHIFAGETRIATKTDAITMQTPVLHYYHPDHLGTTSYLSDKDQNLVQHERYFAFGELWRPGGEQEETDLSRPNGDRREWLFTGKEWDVDTDLYYFGARYFDPHADVWQSTDPVLAGYVRRAAVGASPANLGLYAYAWNNPIGVRDADGRQAVPYAAPGIEPPAWMDDAEKSGWTAGQVRGIKSTAIGAVNAVTSIPALFGPGLPYAAPGTVEWTNPVGQAIADKLRIQNSLAGDIVGAFALGGGFKLGLSILGEMSEASSVTRLALGLRAEGAREGFRAWAARMGFQTFDQLSPRMSTDLQRIDYAMANATELHFNMEGFTPPSRPGPSLKVDFGSPRNGYTRYEYAKTRLHYGEKTTYWNGSAPYDGTHPF